MKLFTQIWNERKHNIGIWLELLVVSVILWYVVDSLYVTLSIYCEPKGFNIENTYCIEIQELDKKSPRYKTVENGGISNGEAILEIMSRLRNHPDIESVCLSIFSHPYCGGNMARYCTCDTFCYSYQYRSVSSDFPKVFQLYGIRGETPEQLSDELRENHVLVSQFYHPEVDLLNKTLHGLDDDSTGYIVGSIIHVVKHRESSIPWADAVYQCYTEQAIAEQYAPDMHSLVHVRTKEGTDKDFAKKLFSMSSNQYQVGNLLMTDVHSVEIERQITMKKDINKLSTKLGIIFFLLANIFFGILGTFWFRTQQRRHEIALFRAIGSSQMQVYQRIVAEGLVLLVAGSICAWVVDYFIANARLNEEFYGDTLTAGRFLLTIGFTLLCMVVMVVVGIMIPARKAQKIEISTALHED